MLHLILLYLRYVLSRKTQYLGVMLIQPFHLCGKGFQYYTYMQALRNFNYQLLLLKQVLALTSDLSSYTARHTWATMAYYCEIHPGIISEAMGHSSIIVTETYLKPFKNKKIDEANVTILSSLKRSYICGK